MSPSLTGNSTVIAQPSRGTIFTKEGTFVTCVVELPSQDGRVVKTTNGHIEDADAIGPLKDSAPGPQCPFTNMKIYAAAEKECDLITHRSSNLSLHWMHSRLLSVRSYDPH